MASKKRKAPVPSCELHPAFIENMRALLGFEAEALLRALDEAPALALRINPLRQGAESAAAPYAGDAVPWEPNGHYILNGARPGASIAHFSGAFYVQEASAMLPAAILAPRPGMKVLDLCAAPGGKASQLAAALGGQGTLVANEPDQKRARALAGNLERLGVKNAIVVNEYPQKLAEKWPGFFDAILVDAPWSGEGMFRRDIASRGQWQESSPSGCAKRQREILESAAVMLAPGGRLLYSTCTYNDQENEGVAGAFLADHPEFRSVGFRANGLGDFPEGMARIWPHRVRGDGQFAALMIQAEGQRPAHPTAAVTSRDAASLLERFAEEFAHPGDGFYPAVLGDTLYAVPHSAPDARGLRVISPGLALAKVLNGRLEPCHQAAMALPELPGVELSPESALAYVRGEAVPCDGAGWLVARYGGMPLGWGKASGGTLKNHLPKGLRRAVEL